MATFKLPELGENITSGSITNILINVGDTITKGQSILELETDKAVVEVPSTIAGVVKAIHVKQGDDVSIGQDILTVDADASAPAEKATPEAPKEEAPKEETPKEETPKEEAPQEKSQPTPATSTRDTQVVVIGGGPGGYTAAFHAADLGLKTTIVELNPNPGGVCLYWGCIPSKALLHAAKIMADARDAKDIGITFEQPSVDIDKLRAWKQKVVTQLTGGLGQLSKQRNITFVQGRASFIDSHTLNIEKADGSVDKLTFDNAILATGSHPIVIPSWPKSARIIDSTGALELHGIPGNMLVVGGGVIGLELGTVYAEFGTKIDVVEMLPSLLTGADKDLVQVLQKRLKKLFNDIMVKTKVTGMTEKPEGIVVSFEDEQGKTFDRTYDRVLVSIGRRPNSANLGLENTNVQLDEKGFVKANAQQLTDDPSIYAIGDLIGQPMLAHKASHEGIVAAQVIAGEKAAFEPKTIPGVVYTDPEVAWCGITEDEAKANNIPHHVAKFPWGASGRSLTQDRTDGLTKLIFDPDTQVIIGMGICGVGAGELIAEGVLAIEMGATATDIKMTIHPHPTTSETIMESAESFFGQATHVYRPKKNS